MQNVFSTEVNCDNSRFSFFYSRFKVHTMLHDKKIRNMNENHIIENPSITEETEIIHICTRIIEYTL